MRGIKGGTVENEGLPTLIAAIIAATLVCSMVIAAAVIICVFTLISA